MTEDIHFEAFKAADEDGQAVEIFAKRALIANVVHQIGNQLADWSTAAQAGNALYMELMFSTLVRDTRTVGRLKDELQKMESWKRTALIEAERWHQDE